ncbi:MAG: glycerate kinase, partial [Saprospiraceae bacterium]|nr:glycerate kinase [Saprospiraceae bacterium]
MRILLVPDKFKASLSSNEICSIIGQQLTKEFGDSISIEQHPMADGGDGSLNVLSQFIPFQQTVMEVKDPLGKNCQAYYCTHDATAYVELAIASGIAAIPQSYRNPRYTSTYGTGQLIKNAIDNGYKNIFLFLGGSSTNDAGTGIASALGYTFLNKDGSVLQAVGDNLGSIDNIQYNGDIEFNDISIQILCDVTNPLYGLNGAAYTFAQQKGANQEDIEYLDKGLQSFAEVLKSYSGIEVQEFEGAGAAGGIGA